VDFAFSISSDEDHNKGMKCIYAANATKPIRRVPESPWARGSGVFPFLKLQRHLSGRKFVR
jgi:hypothetical protein